MIYFNKEELKEILRTFKYGSYISNGDPKQLPRRLKIIKKLEKQLTLISNNKISNDYWEGTR